jgi:hypothetical protein
MKKVILVFVLVFGIKNTVFCQNCINTDDLIGYWRCLDLEATELFFWKDVTGKLQVQELSSTTGEPLDVITFRMDEDAIFMRTFFTPTNFASECIYTSIDNKTLKCELIGEVDAPLIYKKVK